MNEAPTPDGTLLRRYREAGDEAAFAELRRRHGRLVLATCRRETGDPALAEDAAQGAFLLLTRKPFDDDASLAGWLHGAARLVSRNLVREEGRRRRRERRAFEEVQAPDQAWEAVSPHVDAALASLKPGDREAVLLRFAGEMSLAEVGRTLGVEENAARMRVARSLERMRGHLRRAGVGVGVLLLATLLSTRLADAESLPLAPPSTRAHRLAKLRFPLVFSWPVALGASIVLGAALFAASSLGRSSHLDSMETKILFSKTAGSWAGTLEYADDVTGALTKTATTVEVNRQDGGLRVVARFPDYKNVDTTTFARQADGRYRIDTVGSHRLDGLYDLVRLRDGTSAFVGYSLAVRGDVRLRLTATSNSLELLEEYARDGGAYRFRNRYELRR